MLQRIVVLGLIWTAGVFQTGPRRPTDLVNTEFRANVVAVGDGDTVTLAIPPGRQVKVRIFGIDTPEAGQPFSQEARNFTRVLMFSKDVSVLGKDVDQYDRLVARIAVDGKDASAALLSAGLACHFRRFSDDPALETAEQTARAAHRGFWAVGAKLPACASAGARLPAAGRGRAVATGAVVGNVSNRIYHLTTCRNATCKNCTRRFATRQEAEAAGFRPSGDCIRK